MARRTPYYEELIYDLCGQEKRKGNPGTAVVNVMRKTAKKDFTTGKLDTADSRKFILEIKINRRKKL